MDFGCVLKFSFFFSFIGHRHASRHLNMLDMPHSPETALLDEEEKVRFLVKVLNILHNT